MISRAIRFSKALRNETAKRVPIILGLLLVLLLYQNYANGQKANQTLDRLDKQSRQLKQQGDTITQQNKDIKTLTQALNDKTDNINKHVDCVVALFLPNKPLPGASDIEDCKVTFSPTTSSAPQASPQQSSSTSSPSPQPAPQTQPSQSNNQPTGVKKVCSKLPLLKKVCK